MKRSELIELLYKEYNLPINSKGEDDGLVREKDPEVFITCSKPFIFTGIKRMDIEPKDYSDSCASFLCILAEDDKHF